MSSPIFFAATLELMQRLSAAEVLSLHEKLLADLLSGTVL